MNRNPTPPATKMARVAVVLPYVSTSHTSSRQSSPAIGSTSFQRRGSLSGLLSPRALTSILPPTTSSLLSRRRTIFTDSPFGIGSMSARAVISTPDDLVEALDAVADFSIQPSLLPLPASRPLIVLVPIMTDPPPKVLVGPSTTTPSAVCFPASSPSSPTASISAALDRALAFLRRAKREIDDIEQDDGSQVVLMGYSTSPDLPKNISAAALNEGAKCILTPPFTPNSLVESFSESLDMSADSLLTSSSSTVLLPHYPPFAPSPLSAGPVSFMSSFSAKISSLSSWSFQRPMSTYYVDKPLPPKPLPPLPPDAGSRGSLEYSRVSFSKHLPPPLSLDRRYTRPVSPPLPALPPEASTSDLVLPLTPELEAPTLPMPLSLEDSHTQKYADPVAEYINSGRRRSVDTGGLALALAFNNDGDWFSPRARGTGWGGWEDTGDIEGPLYAELLGDMYMQTQATTTVALPTDPSSSAFLRSPLRQQLIQSLSGWKFEPHLFGPDELLGCTYLLFEALFKIEGMVEDCAVTPAQLLPFLYALRSIYHTQNKYHNFQHAVDVHQAIYSFLVKAGCTPPITILLEDTHGLWKKQGTGRVRQVMENRDLFALCIAAVGHDVGHPGLSNAFMKNARTPLSVVYDDKSALEQMHCALLLQLMRKHNLGHLISTPPTCSSSSPISPEAALEFRRLLIQTVLITDMSLHFEWIGRFRALAESFKSSDGGESLPTDGGKLLFCQALIKCGDISNPTRPHAVSEHWSTALLEEWSCQASLEQELGLPISVVSTTDRIVQAKGQIGFIDLFTKPLFDATASAISELAFFANQCNINRALWQERLDALNAEANAQELTTSTLPNEAPQSPISPIPLIPRTLSPPQELHYRSVFPLSIPPSLLTPLPPPSPVSPWLASTASHLEERERELESDREDDSTTPTISLMNSETRLKRVSSSIHSATSSIASPSPFSPIGGHGDNSSTAASSPLSHPRSLTSGEHPLGLIAANGHQPVYSGDVVYPTATRAAYHNATVKKKKSFHRISWDVGRNLGGKFEIPPVPSTPSPLRVESANSQRTP